MACVMIVVADFCVLMSGAGAGCEWEQGERDAED